MTIRPELQCGHPPFHCRYGRFRAEGPTSPKKRWVSAWISARSWCRCQPARHSAELPILPMHGGMASEPRIEASSGAPLDDSRRFVSSCDNSASLPPPSAQAAAGRMSFRSFLKFVILGILFLKFQGTPNPRSMEKGMAEHCVSLCFFSRHCLAAGVAAT